MPVLSRLPAPSPRGGGRSSAAVPGARSRRRSVGARGSSRAGRPRPEGGGPGSECRDAALRCTCPTTAQVKPGVRSPIRAGRGPRGPSCPDAPPEPGQQEARPERRSTTRRPSLTRLAPAQPRSRCPRQLPQLARPLPTRLRSLRQSIARVPSTAPEWPAVRAAATPFSSRELANPGTRTYPELRPFRKESQSL